jgi:hypothetical protein
MKRLLPIFCLLFLSWCYYNRNINNNDIPTELTWWTHQDTSFIKDIIIQIPDCWKEYTGDIISIDSVVKNCGSISKQWTYPYDIPMESDYRVFNGRIWVNIWEYIITDATFSNNPFSSVDIAPINPIDYLCKSFNSGYNEIPYYNLYIPYTWENSTKIEEILKNNQMDFQLSFISDSLFSSISYTYCQNKDTDCKDMYDKWLRTDGKNYFIWWSIRQSPIYLINNRFYDPGTWFDNERWFSSTWSFAEIRDNNIIVKKAIQWHVFNTSGSSEYVLITCEIPL